MQRNTNVLDHLNQLPEHLYAAHKWISAAGEWNEAIAEPAKYAAEAHANSIENEQFVSESDLLEVIEWHNSNG